MSDHPGPRAENVHPSPHGEDYSYVVDKFWTVSAVYEDGTIDAVTRTGKLHHLKEDDPLLRKASVVEKMRFKDRFPDGSIVQRSPGSEAGTERGDPQDSGTG